MIYPVKVHIKKSKILQPYSKLSNENYIFLSCYQNFRRVWTCKQRSKLKIFMFSVNSEPYKVDKNAVTGFCSWICLTPTGQIGTGYSKIYLVWGNQFLSYENDSNRFSSPTPEADHKNARIIELISQWSLGTEFHSTR